MTKPITSNNFNSDVLENEKLVLVDFWAEWCGPCKQIAPRLEELENKYENNLSVCKVDVDQNRDLALEYNVRSIPSLLLFKSGQNIDTLIGAVTLEELEDFVTRNL
jgi:thioredoxin 1|tara:strand:- start:6323 stop:6640 length:318 start_codon:yes stop_codon:yes gene_type:complete